MIKIRLRHFVIAIVLAVFAGAVCMTAPALANSKYASIVMEAETGRVLRARAADVERHPASLTKMMTLYLTFEAIETGKLSFDRRLRVSRHAAKRPPSRLGLRAGERIMVRDAVLALITKSANDVAVVLAEGISGSESAFAFRMTAKARALGMSRTQFKNASGLHHIYQHSTAHDVATLARALIYDFPQYYSLFATKSFTWRGRTYGNHNRLVGACDGVDGLKTGYVSASGYNLATSAARDGRRVIAVVLGGKSSHSRNAHMEFLLDLGFARLKHLGLTMTEAPPDPVIPPSKAASLRTRLPSVKPLANQSVPLYAAKPAFVPPNPKRKPNHDRLELVLAVWP
ncbi:MAG: D-alanyl-D-alanine carboxypeptidase family protein [Pseudomonadota bacterium]|nr:D-alanyl-D-alanine carboxypeptidase family protein [Pseudomonadota bacterium]